MKTVVVLGSTGSIGTQALDVIRANPSSFSLLGISANDNAEALAEQAAAFQPRYVGIADASRAMALQDDLPAGVELLAGEEANSNLAALREADIVLIGISGFAGLQPLLAALNAGKTVALANKESVVCGNRLIKEALQAYGGRILPVDSEHSAIFQCLQNGGKEEAAAIHLTASGGPFWRLPRDEWASVTPERALCHPVWRMGQKISIDSATLMNKGLELIEASYLFDMPERNIFVLIHPQSIVHSMVEYCDGTVIAQLSAPDMRLAIQYALSWPKRLQRQIPQLNLAQMGRLEFESAEGFDAILLAREALRGPEALPIAYCIADEVAVEAFLQRRIGFMGILQTVAHTMEHMPKLQLESVPDIWVAADCAKEIAATFIAGKAAKGF